MFDFSFHSLQRPVFTISSIQDLYWRVSITFPMSKSLAIKSWLNHPLSLLNPMLSICFMASFSFRSNSSASGRLCCCFGVACSSLWAWLSGFSSLTTTNDSVWGWKMKNFIKELSCLQKYILILTCHYLLYFAYLCYTLLRMI